MSDRIQAIRDELDADPLTRGYAGMTDIQVADSMNAIDRPAPIGTTKVRDYVFLEKYRTNDGADTVQSQIYGRIKLVCEAATDADTFGTGTTNENATVDRKASAVTLLEMLRLPDYLIDLSNSKVQNMLNDMKNAGVMANADKNAIQALGDNQQSRGTEIGVGNVRENDVVLARAL